jgi:aspartate aminotransferase
MPRSSIRRIFSAVKELTDRGEQVIPLHIGDPDFELPPRIATGVAQAISRGYTHYGPVRGITPLREAVAKHVAHRFGIPCADASAPNGDALSMEHVIMSQGATQALNAVLQLTCDRGHTVLLPEVHFPNYMQQCVLAGVRAKLYPLDDNFQPQLDQLDELVDESVKAILINTPSNPTGALFSPSVIHYLYRFAQRYNLWIISDEAYMDYVYDSEYQSPLSVDWEQPPELRRVLAVMSFSKSYAATGLRIGWTVCPRVSLAQQLGLMNEPLVGSITTPLQYGLIEAFREDDTTVRRQSLNKRRLLAAKVLNEHGFKVEPVAGGMFYFLDISATGLDSDTFADRLLAEEHVAVVPGSGFGLEPSYHADGSVEFAPNELAARCVRLCFAVPSDTLTDGVKRLAQFYSRYFRRQSAGSAGNL